ncbi:MAG: hypothetical protein EA349_03935 [Halomonadaceae bacterium]|nr:MAG: hypothetical protein EA349_03935 [Halomonadaceae bacterium]
MQSSASLNNCHELTRQLVLVTGLTALLWGFHLYARTLETGVLGVIWLGLALVIARGLFWRARIRRRAWLQVYVRPGSAWRHWLRGGVVMALVRWLLGLLLAALLLLVLVRRDQPLFWQLLLLSGPLLIALRVGWERLAARDFQPGYRQELVWSLSLRVAGATLLLALVWLFFHQPQPDLTGASLAQALWHYVDQEQARSAWLEGALQAMAAKEGLQFWLAQHLVSVPGAHWLGQLLLWLLLFAEQALFVGAWLLVFNGIIIKGQRYADPAS